MNEGKAYVYAIQHSATGKIYVGCTKSVERRISEHLKLLLSGKHPNEQMQADYNAYGGEYFYYVLFSAYAAYDAFMAERLFMSLLGTRDPARGYNSGDSSKEFSLKNYSRKKAIKLLLSEEAKNGKTDPGTDRGSGR